jgi:hypothetical protein
MTNYFRLFKQIIDISQMIQVLNKYKSIAIKNTYISVNSRNPTDIASSPGRGKIRKRIILEGKTL